MVGSFLRLASGALFAVFLSQFPEFAQQYMQRLGGMLDALRPIVEQFDRSAAGVGLTRESLIERLQGNPDAVVVDITEANVTAIERFERLERQRADLVAAGEFGRLYVFLRDYDREVAARTYDDFRPAVPTTLEGIVHAGGGFLVGYGLVGVPGALAKRRRKRLAFEERFR